MINKEISKEQFIEAKRLSTIIASMFNAMQVETVVGTAALSILLNVSIKAMVEIEEKSGMVCGKDFPLTTTMIEGVLKSVLSGLGEAKIIKMEELHKFMKERMYGDN